MITLINSIYSNSSNALPYFVNREQKEIVRYTYCGIEKVNKVFRTFQLLYPSLDNSSDVEFSLGIIARSLLMDMILMMGAKKITSQANEENFDTVKIELSNYSYKVLNDGTEYFIQEIYSSSQLSENEKREKAEKFASLFPKAYKLDGPKPKILDEYRLNLKKILKEVKEEAFFGKDQIKNLYAYYSKYDHLSHYTGLVTNSSIELRKGKIKTCIVLTAMYLYDLLVLGFIWGENLQNLKPIILNVKNCIENLEESTLSA